MGKTLVIYNPISGHGRAARYLPNVQAELRALGIQFDVARTHESLHAVQLAWDAPMQGYERVLSVGGDGLLHEIVNGLLRASNEGVTLPLGIIPLGNGNDLNKMIPPECNIGETHDDWLADVRKVAAGKTMLFDVGRIVGDNPAPGHPHPHYFHNSFDVGFGAQVAEDVRSIPKFFRSTSMYLLGALRQLAAYQLPRLRLQLDDGTIIEERSTMTTITNGRCLGGGFWIAPQARANDGKLDVMFAKALGRAGILAVLPRVMRGTHLTHPAVTMIQAARVVIDSPDPLVVEADGEIPFLEAHHLEVQVLPQRLCLIV